MEKYALQVMLQEKEVFIHGTYAKTIGRNLEQKTEQTTSDQILVKLVGRSDQ